MPYLTLVDVLNLPNVNKDGVALEEVHLSYSMNIYPLAFDANLAMSFTVSSDTAPNFLVDGAKSHNTPKCSSGIWSNLELSIYSAAGNSSAARGVLSVDASSSLAA